MIAKNDEKIYFKTIKRGLLVQRKVRNEFLEELHRQFDDIQSAYLNCTLNDIYDQIGTPEEVIRNFETREDFECLKKKYSRSKKICIGCLLLAMVAIIIISICTLIVNDSIKNGHGYIKETVNGSLIVQNNNTKETDK